MNLRTTSFRWTLVSDWLLSWRARWTRIEQLSTGGGMNLRTTRLRLTLVRGFELKDSFPLTLALVIPPQYHSC